MESDTGINRSIYLDLAECIVRSALSWQRDDGIIIDPTIGEEAATTTARFVGALGLLIGAERCGDLVEVCAKSMDHCCKALAGGTCKGPDFYTKELLYAYRALRGRVSLERHKRWRQWLSDFDPWQTYWSARSRATHNWAIYAIVGEFLKQAEGLVDARDFIDELLTDQSQNFTELGMYRDPGDPITYDLTVRQQLGLMLLYGYDGRHRMWIDEALRKGGLTTLLLQSVTGQAPFGGRSNQFHIQEAMTACICEMEARRYVTAGRPALAGAFKRAARRAALCTRRWILDMTPFRHTKHGFTPELRHGIDSGGEYSCYGLLAASLFATAWYIADETITEHLTPAESGGFVIELWPAFHKVFASCGGYHIEIDTKADLTKDATGLGRLHKLDAPTELALSMPISAAPSYTLSIEPPKCFLTIGPGWKDRAGNRWYMAQFSSEIEDVRLNIISESLCRIEFVLTYEGELGGVRSIAEHYTLTPNGLHYTAALSPTPSVHWLSIPVLESDGHTNASYQISSITERNKSFKTLIVPYQGRTYKVIAEDTTQILVKDEPLANRNGIYREGVLVDSLSAKFSIE